MIPSADIVYKNARQAHTPEDVAATKMTMDIVMLIEKASCRGDLNAQFNVPIIVSGLPAYDMKAVTLQLVRNFKASGYRVTPSPCMLSIDISWDEAAKNKAKLTMMRK